MTDADRFQRLEAIFHRVRRLPAAERAAAIDQACGSDAALRRELDELLAAHEAPSDDLLDRGPATPRATDAAPPERLGRYRLLHRIGEGGTAVVYLAEQDAPRRQVALKILRGGVWSGRALGRFELEAEMLGRMKHPGIASVLEAGVDTSGEPTPFIAMEFVDGPPLDRWRDDVGPARRARLEVFLRICDAVQYAHQHGVIHRDLKPANILVTEGAHGPAPRVLDFGLARDLADGERRGTHTSAGELLGTVSFMSPEQAAGDLDAVDARTDVHGLGGVLFDLLSGRPARPLDGRPLDEVVRAVREDDPPRLSSVDPVLAGELEVITATAMARRPEERYQTVAALAEDVRRHLNDEPIMALPPSRLVSAVKFLRRRRGAVAAVAAVALTLLVGFAATAQQAIAARRAESAERAERRRAEARFEELRELANVFLFEFDETLETVPGTLPARSLIVSTGLDYLDRLAHEASDDPELQLEVARGFVRLGDIQGGRWRPNLGDLPGALGSYQRAAALLAPGDDGDRSPIAAVVLRAARIKQADLLMELGDQDDATALYELVRADAMERRRQDSADGQLADDLSAVLFKLAIAARVDGRPQDALALLSESDDLLDALQSQRGSTTTLRRSVAANRFQTALALRSTGDVPGAIEELERFADTMEDVIEEDPEHAQHRRDLIAGSQLLGLLLISSGDRDAGVARLEQTLALAERNAAAAPDDVDAIGLVATLSCSVGEQRLADRRLVDAAFHFDRYLDAASERVRRSPGSPHARRELGVAHYKLGELHRTRSEMTDRAVDDRRRDLVSACAQFEACLEVFRSMASAGALKAGDAGAEADITAQLEDCRARLARAVGPD